nr:hypothetical protein [Streptomyces sp. FT05W]
MAETPSPALWRLVDEDDATSLTLIVETPSGPHLRRIPPALPLPAHIEHGTAAEEAAHTAAATWGLPDFVFQQVAHAAKGSGSREQGDRLLIAGHRGVVVQVKARTIAPKADALEANWIQKVAAKAMSQAKGSVRHYACCPPTWSTDEAASCTWTATTTSGSRCSSWTTPAYRKGSPHCGSRPACPHAHIRSDASVTAAR